VRRRLPSPATGIAFVALLLVLGGSAYAISSVHHADVANQVKTLKTIDVRMNVGAKPRVLVHVGPFTVKGWCLHSGNPVQNVLTVAARTSENDAAIEWTDIFGATNRDPDFDRSDGLIQITTDQESGTPPLPAGPFHFSADMISRSGTSLTLQLAQGQRLFSDNSSAQKACVYYGSAAIHR